MNIFRTANINKQQTRNHNRFTVRFGNALTQLIQKASQYQASGGNTIGRAIGPKGRYDALKSALNFTNVSVDQTLELSLLSCSVPQIEIDHQEIHKFNDHVKSLTKFATLGEMTVTFYDYIQGSSSAIMFIWHALCGDKSTGAIGYKEDYILENASLLMYGPDAPAFDTIPDSAVIEEHEIVNMYPKSIDIGEHTFESGDARKLSVTFIIDNIYPIRYSGTPTKVYVPAGA